MQDPLWFPERQAFEKEIVDQRKDRSVQSNPERECDHGNRSERRRLSKFSEGETKVVHLRRLKLLLVAQSNHWIDSHRAASRKISRNERGPAENHRDDRVDPEIVRAYAVKQTRHQARDRE